MDQLKVLATRLKEQNNNELLEQLADILTPYDSCTLTAMIRERTSSVNRSKRLGIYPIENWDRFIRSKKLEASLWSASEVQFEKDLNDFLEFTEEEKQPIINSFKFFSAGDGTVSEALLDYLLMLSDSAEERLFYAHQFQNEHVHIETYGNMIHTLVKDPEKRRLLFESVENDITVKNLNDWIEMGLRNPDGKRQLYIRLVLAEFLMFTPLFCIIFWYKAFKPGKIKQIIFSNEQIAKDEGAHCKNGAMNYLALPSSERYTDVEVHKQVDEVITLMDAFIENIFKDITLPRISADSVKQYCRFVADELLVGHLNHGVLYNVQNPFEWMEYHRFVPKTNFYEGTVGQYTRFNVNKAVDYAKEMMNIKQEESDDEDSDTDSGPKF